MDRKKIFLSLTVLFATVSYVNSLNILGIFPFPGASHFTVHRVYLQELVKRGHNLTVISHFPEYKPIENYHDISLANGAAKVMSPVDVDNYPFLKSYFTVLHRAILLMVSGRATCKNLLANKEVQRLIDTKPKFDLVVVEQFNSDCALGVAYKLQAPVVGINSHTLMAWQYSRFGIPHNPSFVPFPYWSGGSKPTLLQKMEITFFDFYFKALYFLYEQRGDQQTLAEYFDYVPPLESLAREIKFLLLYQNFILTGSRLLPANVIEVGGYHVAKPKPLPQDLQKFMDDADSGVICISFGSVVKSSTMPTERINAIIGAMKKLPQRFVWKWENDAVLLDINKLYISSWLPQVDVLAHPNTVAFLSHAGMGGTTEALHFGVPIVAMPMFGDQPSTAAAIEESGLGVRIDAESLTEEKMLAAFNKVLDPEFRGKVKTLSRAWHDRPLPPLQTAMYWTEFAARYSNLTFRAPSADVPLYQYYNLDLIFVFLLVILILISIIKIIISILYKKLKKISLALYPKHKKNV